MIEGILKLRGYWALWVVNACVKVPLVAGKPRVSAFLDNRRTSSCRCAFA